MTEHVGISPKTVHGWGGGAGAPVDVVRPLDQDSLHRALDRGRRAGSGAIARGLGRSYGDAAQLRDGLVLDMTALDRFEFDAELGIITAEAGATLHALLAVAIPAGWILPAVPGTQHVTVGGMIASDVHGKNHHAAGSFGDHILGLGLLRSTGEVVELRPGAQDGWFEATIGGMGLTGVILWARIALQPIAGPNLSVDTDRVNQLDDAIGLLAESGPPHRVAWLDLLGGTSVGHVRGVVTRAEHVADGDPFSDGAVGERVTVPAWFPGGLLRPGTVRAYNEFRYRAAPASERGRHQPFGAHMFPLDALAAWPRLYGRDGLVQYQFAVPEGEERTIAWVIATLRAEGVPCYLAVLKRLGEGNAAPLSFPLRGYSLALDLPRAHGGLTRALSLADELVTTAGGRVYLTKDSRLRPELLAAMYPRLAEWREAQSQIDSAGLWSSDLAARVGLVGAPQRASRLVTAPPPTPRRVLLIGGTSEIGTAIVRRIAAEGPVTPYLLARDEAGTAASLDTLRHAGCDGGGHGRLDVRDTDAHEAALDDAVAALGGGIDVIVLAAGVLGAQEGLEADRATAEEVLDVNLLGCGMLLISALARLKAQGSGSLVVLSSVAAERPRAGNAVYGAAKAGLDALAQGLTDSVHGSGVEVVVVRPGFVTTKMTAGLKPAPFATTAEAVAEATVAALGGGSATLWVPAILRPVFSALRHLPRSIYRRLPL